MATKITKHDQELLEKKYSNNMSFVEQKLEENYPVQYLIGDVNFYGYTIQVDQNVLIPRFETELLLEKTIQIIKMLKIENPKILDIGTGSGCIPIVLKKEIECNITSIDISEEALNVAKKNSNNNNVEINFINKDIIKDNIDGIYDVIISNPPYLTKEDIVSPQIYYEPQKALFAEENGLIFYKEILKKSIGHINKKSLIAFEIGDKQRESLIELANTYYPTAKVLAEKDLSGKDRYIFIINE